eukprot:2131869-Pyramimonas_sp.AAC.1
MPGLRCTRALKPYSISQYGPEYNEGEIISGRRTRSAYRSCKESYLFTRLRIPSRKFSFFQDMVAHDGSEERVRAAVSTVTNRVRFCGDMFELRMTRAIRMRMSLSRDTDH